MFYFYYRQQQQQQPKQLQAPLNVEATIPQDVVNNNNKKCDLNIGSPIRPNSLPISEPKPVPPPVRKHSLNQVSLVNTFNACLQNNG